MLNPFRETMSRAAQEANGRPSPFFAEAEAALSGFRATRSELERQVRRGDLTPKVARERAGAAAAELQSRLLKQSEGYSPTSRLFLDRLIDATEARRKARETLSIEGLQRETNRLLRLNLMEQQLQARAPEFEGRAYTRPVTGGPPGPSLDGLLGFQRMAVDSGDEVAVEWGLRQLEGFRNRVVSPEDSRKIDLATDRPDRVNPRLIDAYCESLRDRGEDELETFVERARQEGDTNACIASFVMARQAPEGPRLRWVRKVLSGLAEFPDPALATLRSLEAEARAGDSEAAQAQARYIASMAEAEAALEGLEAPSAAELERASKIEARPVARPGEAIGLNLDRRGILDASESAAIAEDGF
ncbi:hypothetical protein P12x_002221 [Tundrisphaera lichenicola]|uniref:hypothetical protein n=1 Tax=Tundrisphaera lichenicola TaxID=2029860 RepID=UPI003EB96F78